MPAGIVDTPSFSTLGLIDFSGWYKFGTSEFWGLFGATAAILAVVIFDAAGCQYGIAMRANLLDKNEEVPRGKWGFLSVGVGTIFGSYLGTSPLVIANESSAGVMEGARTGFSSLVCAALFVCSSFLSPLLTSVPQIATSVPLVLVGAFMVAPVAGINWDDLMVAIPSFVTITVVPFTYSISNGVVAGLLVQMYLESMNVLLRYCGFIVNVEEAQDGPGEKKQDLRSHKMHPSDSHLLSLSRQSLASNPHAFSNTSFSVGLTSRQSLSSRSMTEQGNP